MFGNRGPANPESSAKGSISNSSEVGSFAFLGLIISMSFSMTRFTKPFNFKPVFFFISSIVMSMRKTWGLTFFTGTRFYNSSYEYSPMNSLPCHQFKPIFRLRPINGLVFGSAPRDSDFSFFRISVFSSIRYILLMMLFSVFSSSFFIFFRSLLIDFNAASTSMTMSKPFLVLMKFCQRFALLTFSTNKHFLIVTQSA